MEAKTIETLLARYGGASPELLRRVLTPYRLRIIRIEPSADRRHATFEAEIPNDVLTTFEVGTTGKVVPKEHIEGNEPWHEVVKGRILECDAKRAKGELYFTPPKRFIASLQIVKKGDYLEVDPFGVSSKIESALCEASFFQLAESQGFSVVRMPENVAMHIGTQNYYDFKLERGSTVYRVELKSLWGTDTSKARLIHTVSKKGGGKNSARPDKQLWATSSCRFADQDIFAVSMWLRTGRIDEFAFAASVSDESHKQWGLPRVPKHPRHVTQNPAILDPPSGAWTESLAEACLRVDKLRAKKIMSA